MKLNKFIVYYYIFVEINKNTIRISLIQKNKNINLIIEGIQEKKGKDIVIINLIDVLYAPCSFFIICSAVSKTQINAIIDNVKKVLQEKLNLIIWKEEGKGSNWHLLDYSDIVIHVFKEETRHYYQLEELWGDGKLQQIKESE